MIAAAALAGAPASPARQDAAVDQRAPFALELPDTPGRLLTDPEIPIPSVQIGRLALHIKNPYAAAMPETKIFTRVNGESTGYRSQVDIVKSGKIVTIGLASTNAAAHLRPGRNVVEIEGTTRDGKSYYASFVLRTGGRLPTAFASLESTLATTGTDRTPPTIKLDEPKGWVAARQSNTTALVRGSVFDDSGALASVTVNGAAARLADSDGSRLVRLPSDPSPRAVKYFEQSVTVGPADTAIAIVARDATGNEARLSIPIVKGSPAGAGQRFSGRRLALVVGVTDYGYNVPDLRYAADDARAVAEFLVTPQGGGFKQADIRLLVNQQATLAAVRAGLTDFLAHAGPDDLVYLFIAGHGVASPTAPTERYFLLHDSRVDDIQSTALPMQELADALRDSVRAERAIVFIDTCHSGGIADAGSRGVENNLINLYAEVLFRERGRAVLTSSDVNELSYEHEKWGGHGVFTFALLEGLRGEADVDGNGLVTAGELFGYVRNRVSVATSAKQNPRIHEGSNAELVIAVVPPAPATKRPAAPGGRKARSR
jgi:hypothetical protein